jgi:hypothetical protein
MPNELTQHEHEELLGLYQVTVTDLSYFKTQQWTSTNYFFLLLAGIVGVGQLGHPSLITRLLLIALAVLVAAAALVTLQKLQDSIEVRRARLDRIREYFGPAFAAAWAAKAKKREYIKSVWFLRFAILGGSAIVCWLLLQM